MIFLREKTQKSPKLTPKFVERILEKPKPIRVYSNLNRRNSVQSQCSQSEKDESDLKKALLDIIVSRRLYKDADLKEFYTSIRNYCVYSAETIEKAIAAVHARLS